MLTPNFFSATLLPYNRASVIIKRLSVRYYTLIERLYLQSEGDIKIVMLKLRAVLAVLAFSLMLSIIDGNMVLAADAKPSMPAFGTVDIERAFNEYDQKKQLDQQLMGLAQELSTKLDLRKNNRLLTKEEYDQLVALKAKPNPTADDTKKIDQILALSKDREQQLQALQQKQNPTSEDTAQIKRFQDQINAAAASFDADNKAYEVQFGKERVELSRKVMKEIETTVADIAKQKGLAMVFNKSYGEVSLVIYSSVDVTDEVLKKLNKK